MVISLEQELIKFSFYEIQIPLKSSICPFKWWTIFIDTDSFITSVFQIIIVLSSYEAETKNLPLDENYTETIIPVCF